MLKKSAYSILFFSLLLSSLYPGEFLSNVRKKLNSIKPFKVQFVNQVISDDTVEIEENGVMTFRDSQMIKWEYLEPDHKIWILSGNSYEYYDSEEEQLTRGKLAKKTQLWIFQLLYEQELDKDITIDPEARSIHFLNDEEGVDIKIFFSEILLPSKIIQRDLTGVSIIYIFSDYQSNLILSEGEFIIKTDGGIDIIELE